MYGHSDTTDEAFRIFCALQVSETEHLVCALRNQVQLSSRPGVLHMAVLMGHHACCTHTQTSLQFNSQDDAPALGQGGACTMLVQYACLHHHLGGETWMTEIT